MTLGRLVRIAAITALASGAIAVSVIARAQGGEDPVQTAGTSGSSSSKTTTKKKISHDRKSVGMAAATDDVSSETLAAEVEKPVIAQAMIQVRPRPVPLPPHRPAVEMGGDVSVTGNSPRTAGAEIVPVLPQLVSYSSPSTERFEPSGTLSNSPAETVKEIHLKGVAPVNADMRAMPLPPPRPFLVASIDNTGGEIAGLPPSQMTETAVEPASSILLTQIPVPPARPGFPEDAEQAEAPAPGVQLSSYQQIPEQETKSANWLERLFTAPPGGSNTESEASEAPRRLSKLNRIIGDDPVRATSLKPLISRHAAENGVPFGLADAVVRIESRYNSKARNGPYMGLMQIHHRTARSLGYNGDASGLLDPDTNLRYGIKYLAMAYRLAGGDTCGTILRYQAGHRATSMTSAARNYCSKVKMIHAELTR